MKLSTTRKLLALSTLSLVMGFAASSGVADSYEISVTNVTANQAFTPRLAFSHTVGKLFELGSPALDDLITIAESGDLAPLMSALMGFPEEVTDMQVGDGLLMPGDSQTITLEGDPGSFLTLVNMLIPTNDAFLGVNALILPESGSVTHRATVYDAGSETNDEDCLNIPGPVCGGEGGSPADDGEGFIHVHSGIHGIGDLDAATYDWNNPAAIVTITKI